MLYMIIKLLISALLLVLIAEISKRYTMIGAILASIPLVSVLAMIWLYIDTKNVAAISQLSKDIFWLVLPSSVLFLALPVFLDKKINFYIALSLSISLMILAYFATILLLKHFNIK